MVSYRLLVRSPSVAYVDRKKKQTPMRWSFIAYVYYTVLVLLLWYGQACELLHQMQAKVYMCDASKTLPPNCDVFWSNDYLSFCILSEQDALPSNATSHVYNLTLNASTPENASTTSFAPTTVVPTASFSTTSLAPTTTFLPTTTLPASTTSLPTTTTTTTTLPASTSTTTWAPMATTTTPFTPIQQHRRRNRTTNETPISLAANIVERKEETPTEDESPGMVVAVVVLSAIVMLLVGYVGFQRRKARRATVTHTVVPKPQRKRPPPIKTRSLTLPKKHHFSRPKPRVHRYSHHDRAVIPAQCQNSQVRCREPHPCRHRHSFAPEHRHSSEMRESFERVQQQS